MNKLIAGDRVRLKRHVERFPVGVWNEGRTGTVHKVSHSDEYDEDEIWVKLDQYYPELDEWDNCIVWQRFGDDDESGGWCDLEEDLEVIS